MMLGTVINIVSVAVGTTIGLVFGNFLGDRLKETVTRGVGLFVVILGIGMALPLTQDLGLAVVGIVSVALGALLGEFFDIEGKLEHLGEWLKRQVTKGFSTGENKVETQTDWRSRFVDGFVTSSLLFCVGPMTILGSIRDGINGDPSMLIIKSFLDGLFSITLASTLGVGVLFSIVVIFVYQGGLTLLAGVLALVLGEIVVNAISAVGGLLILGLGVNLTEIGKLRVGNMLPSLVVVVGLIWCLQALQLVISWLVALMA
jgi:uncharacterized membrane protein YqgA involved in biofilm formation